MPVIGHLEGNCHVYVDRDADVRMARSIALNAKMRRTGICGAAETLLVDRACVGDAPACRSCEDLLDAGCEVRGDATVQQGRSRACVRRARTTGTPSIWTPSSPRAWSTASMRRIAHIARYGSAHTESIVTDNAGDRRALPERRSTAPSCCTTPRRSSPTAASSAWARRSASPPTASTPAGRSGVEQLTSYKYVVRGTGQVRARGGLQRCGCACVGCAAASCGAALAVHPAGVAVRRSAPSSRSAGGASPRR